MPQCLSDSEASITSGKEEASPVASENEVSSDTNAPSGSDGHDASVQIFLSDLKSRFLAADLVEESCWKHILQDSLVNLPDDEEIGNQGAQLAFQDTKRMCSDYYTTRYSVPSLMKGIPVKRNRDDAVSSVTALSDG